MITLFLIDKLLKQWVVFGLMTLAVISALVSPLLGVAGLPTISWLLWYLALGAWSSC